MHVKVRLLTIAAGAVLACAPAAANIPPPFGWLSGHWWSNDGGKWTEEIWSQMRGSGQMIGLAHSGSANDTRVFEFMRIAKLEGSYAFYASPNGAPAVSFAMSAGSADCPKLPCEVVFENPANDYPKRIVYRIDRVGELKGSISGADPAKDSMSWTYRKVR